MGNTESTATIQDTKDIKVKNDTINLSYEKLTAIPKELHCLVFSCLDLSFNSIQEIDEQLSNVHIRELSLNSNKLEKVPKNLEKLTSLKILKLSSNKLSNSIPKEILELPNLTNLDLSNNKDISFSEKVESKTLEKVIMSSCQLSTFPKGIAEISSLRVLELICNPNMQFQEEEEIETNIEHLIISSCNISTFPKILSSMKSLTHLDLSYNSLSELKLTKFENLTSLLLSHNSISKIDVEDVNSLNNLKILDLNNNHLIEFPNFVIRLKNLEELYLGYNEIENLPNVVFDENLTPKLKTFVFTKNQIETIPQEFLNNYLLNTVNLNFQSNKLKEYPSLKNLKELKEISFTNNKITKINYLSTSVEKFSIDFNLISSLDDHIYNHIDLKHLILRGNKISKIDKRISNLKNLQVLLFDKNHLNDIPTEEILKLDKLEHFGCSDNGILEIPESMKKMIEEKQFKAHVNFSIAPPDMIVENLYLGSIRSASNRSLFEQLNIKNVLTVAHGINPFHEEIANYKIISIPDESSSDLYSLFDECIDFIIESMKQGPVLVHCQAGVSRSATIITAFIMKSKGMRLDDALKFVRERRSCICPNSGFIEQLKKYESKIFQ
eukprot:gene9566-1769_t